MNRSQAINVDAATIIGDAAEKRGARAVCKCGRARSAAERAVVARRLARDANTGVRPMSILDKIAAAVTPMASEEERAQARRSAEELSENNDWLGQILDHHRQIETAFDRALNAEGAHERQEAASGLALILMAHSNAEEAVIYPALVEGSSKAHTTMAYEEQAAAKINMAILESLDPMSQEWRDKLEHIQGAVLQHVYQEESSWFPDVVRNVPTDKQQLMTKRYSEEFGRNSGVSQANQPSQVAHIA
jgi:hemerythrin superfamily protein